MYICGAAAPVHFNCEEMHTWKVESVWARCDGGEHAGAICISFSFGLVEEEEAVSVLVELGVFPGC